MGKNNKNKRTNKGGSNSRSRRGASNPNSGSKSNGAIAQNSPSNPNSGSISNGTIPPNNPSNPDANPTSTVSDDSNKSNWIKKTIDFLGKNKVLTILTIILTFLGALGAVFGIVQYYENKYKVGTFEVTIDGKKLESSNNDHNYLVFFDKESANLMKFKEFPRIFNPARYSLNDINLKYKIYADSLTEISYRSDYDAEDSPDDEGVAYKEVTYNKEKIMQGDTIPLPFRSFRMKDKAKARIELTATYSGYKTPFNYCANIYTKRIYQEDESNLLESVYKEALSFLESKNDIDKFDLRYIDQEILPEHNSLTANWLREKVASYNPSLEDSTELLADVTLPTYYLILGPDDTIVEIIGPGDSIVEMSADSIIFSHHRRQLLIVRLRDSAGMQLADTFKYGGTIYPTQEEIVRSAYGYYDSLGNYYGQTYLGGNEYRISYNDTAGNKYSTIIIDSTGHIFEGRTLEEIVKTVFFTKDDKPDDKSTPWYLYIVGIICTLIGVVGFAICYALIGITENKKSLVYNIQLIVFDLITSIAGGFAFGIFFNSLQTAFWPGLIYIFAIIIIYDLITVVIDRLLITHDQDDRRMYSYLLFIACIIITGLIFHYLV